MNTLNTLVEQFLKVTTKKEMENFLLGLFTESEREEFIRRIKIIELLKKGIAQHIIAKRLGVGVATVSRGAREIRLGRFITIKV